MTKTQAGSLWPKKSIIVISDENHLYLLIRELVRESGWKVELPACQVSEAIELINTGKAQSVIAIESPQTPANETLRQLFKAPRARLTPTLVLLQEENTWEQLIYEKIFKVEVAIKPLRPNNFIPAFNRLIKLWEQPLMHALRKVAYTAETVSPGKQVAILDKLCTAENSLPFALSAMLQLLVNEGHFKDATKKALATFKDHHTNPAVLAACAWFYISARTPQIALRYLTKLRTISPSSSAFHFDLASSYLACGQLSEAINVMREWNDRRPGNSKVESFLARTIIADGKQDSNDLANIPPYLIRKVADYWDTLETAIEMETSNRKSGLKAS